MSNIWFLIIPSFVIAVIGTKIKKADSQIFEDWTFPWGPASGCKMPGKILFMIGVIGAVTGIFAAFKGPIQIGGLILPSSDMLTNAIDSAINKNSSMKEKYARKPKASKEKVWANALDYAGVKVTATGGWIMKGQSGRLYNGCIHNRGDKHLKSVTIKLTGKTENKNLTISDIAPNTTKNFSHDLGLHFWRMYKSGPYVIGAEFKK